MRMREILKDIYIYIYIYYAWKREFRKKTLLEIFLLRKTL